MQYNFDFELAALLLMIIILLHFIFIRQFPTDKTKVFGMLLLSCIAECILNILSSMGLANAEYVPQVANEIMAFVFFVLEGISSYLIFRYIIVVCEFQGKTKKIVNMFGMIPFVGYEIMVLLTPITGLLYYFEDNQYYQGLTADMGYLYIIYYFVLNVVIVFIRRNAVNLRIKAVVVVYTLVAVISVLLQFCVRGLLLTSVSNMIILLMIYLSMQNPSELLDPVTQIGNDSALTMQLKQLLLYRKKGVVATIKIRQFQHLNTLFGTENCNGLLMEIGQYLYNVCGKFHVFHNTGSSFTVIIEDEQEYQEKIEQIQERFFEDWKVKKNYIVADVSMVVQHYPKDFITVSEFKAMRDYLLEIAKQKSNQHIIETDEVFIEEFKRRSQVEMALHKAIREQAFQVYYQPIYSLKEKRIVSLEALLRLEDEELGFISPGEFIPIAEKNGSIIEIGAWVLEESCRFLSKHVLSNRSLGIRTIQINLSVVQCMQHNFTETIAEILSRHHVPPSMITLEITESMAINAQGLMERYMKELGELGITFAADDYGTGNSNCSYLVRFPFKEVKIDREMTWAYFENETAKVVLENEIKTMKQLGIPLVVEGIEKLEQSEVMERLGVEYIQGYYYGQPLSENDCLRYIRNFNSMPEEYGR